MIWPMSWLGGKKNPEEEENTSAANEPVEAVSVAAPEVQKEAPRVAEKAHESAPDNDPAAEARVVEAIRSVFDPEIPVNIYDMGLIYRIAVKDGKADITMTLTSPGCPEAITLPPQVENVVRCVDGVDDARVDVVWDPPWDPSRMSDAAKLQLGML